MDCVFLSFYSSLFSILLRSFSFVYIKHSKYLNASESLTQSWIHIHSYISYIGRSFAWKSHTHAYINAQYTSNEFRSCMEVAETRSGQRIQHMRQCIYTSMRASLEIHTRRTDEVSEYKRSAESRTTRCK